ncbi:MAG: phytanoyl-CoA dioxygenase family protein [Planctomycetota bacterium]|nr:MAG: phytanoyl-CoA dioxygenase family protein [Planctomycetota bacterium]
MPVVQDSTPEAYRRRGYAVVDKLLSPGELAALQSRIAEIAAGPVSSFPREYLEFEPERPESPETVRKVNNLAEFDPELRQLVCGDAILDVVETLIGPDIKLFGSQCFMKPPGGVEKPYHQDSAYFCIEPRALVTCWIALDDVTLENGCLWVIPGSHLGRLHDHSEPWKIGDRVDIQVPQSRIEIDRETPITMPAGSCSFHHSMLLHRSGPNRTDRSRRGLAVHFMSSRSRWTDARREQPDYPLLRGREYENCV